MKLYLVTDDELLKEKELLSIVEQAVQGGVTMVQLRKKHASTKDFVAQALALKKMLTPYQVPLIINDRVDVALASNADGVHLGQTDMPFLLARKILGNQRIIGLSVESKEQVLTANKLEVDYIAASPVFSTLTKTDTLIEWGLEGVQWIKSVSKHPLIAIGGIHLHSVRSVFEAGADGVAVISGIICASDAKEAAQAYLREAR